MRGDSVSASQREKAVFVFYLVPEFTMLAFSAAIEALRLANQVIGYDAYAWRIVSANGSAISASCGLSINVDCSLSMERAALLASSKPRMAIVVSGRNVDRYGDRSMEAWLRESRKRGVLVGALCTGSHLLAKAGVLDHRNCTIHWENYPAFVEQFHKAIPSSSIYEIDDGIYTSAGGTASFDMMLHVIVQDFGTKIAMSICHQALLGRVRDKSERQRVPFSLPQGVDNIAIKVIIANMEEHLAEPLSIERLASQVNLSRRQMERLFRQSLDCSPARYYLKLRVERAKFLLTQTSMAVVEVAVACGFVSASHFAQAYRSIEGCSPHDSRKSALPEWADLGRSDSAA